MLTHEQMVAIIRAGGTVAYYGTTLAAVGDVPTDIQIAQAVFEKGLPTSGGSGGPASAVTVANGADGALGATTDAAVVNPALAATLIALDKGQLTELLALVATLGAAGDSAVGTDAAGTLNAHVRGLVKILALSLPAALNQAPMAASLPVVIASDQTAVPVTPAATEAHLGAVGGLKATATAAFTQAAGGTAYSPKDAVAPAPLTVSAATNATPIVVTTGTHGLIDADVVTIAGMVGNTAGNGTFYVKVTGFSTTTFALYSDKALTTPVAGNGAWSSGGTGTRLLRFAGLARVAGGTGYLVKASLLTDQTTFTDGPICHLYSIPPAAILDNAACTAPLYANAAGYSGSVLFTGCTVEGTGATAAYSNMTPNTSNSKLPLAFKCQAGDTDLYGILETVAGFTPANPQSFTLKITSEAD